MFCCRYCCIRAISTNVRSTVLFVGKPCAGGVVGAEDIDINEAWEYYLGGFISLICTEIVFEFAWLGWRRVHAASEENGVYEITSYPSCRRSCANACSMDRVVIQ